MLHVDSRDLDLVGESIVGPTLAGLILELWHCGNRDCPIRLRLRLLSHLKIKIVH